MSRLSKAVFPLAYIYCALPLVIFFMGWLKIYIAIPAAAVLIAALWFCMKNSPDISPETDKNSVAIIAAALFIIVLWVLLSGIGRVMYQNPDHLIRNTVYEILVNQSWPVKAYIPTENGTEGRGLIYYIGFWMPAAVVGKIFGTAVGYVFQMIWAVLGIFLLYMLICAKMGKIRLFPLVVFIFFSGLDIVGFELFYGDVEKYNIIAHIEWWTGADIFQFSSFTTQLFWVFNQAIPAWILTLLAYSQKNNRNIVFLAGLSMLNSTLPFVGMIPLFLCFVFEKLRSFKKEDVKAFAKDLFGFVNILGGGISGIISFIYLKGNASGQNIGSAGSVSYGSSYFILAALFVLLEAGVYYLAVLKYQKKRPIFYISLIWLCICPIIRVGSAADFCMRASVPALFMLYMLVTETLAKAFEKKDRVTAAALIVILCIGAVTAVHEISRSVVYTVLADGHPLNASADEYEVMTAGNFSGKLDGNFFFEYLAK